MSIPLVDLRRQYEGIKEEKGKYDRALSNGLKRAGADIIITGGAVEVAGWRKEG